MSTPPFSVQRLQAVDETQIDQPAEVLIDCVEGGASVSFMPAFSRECGRTLLVLDTVTGGDAGRLYSRLGWERAGVIPGYALPPQGGLCSTTLFYRTIGG